MRRSMLLASSAGVVLTITAALSVPSLATASPHTALGDVQVSADPYLGHSSQHATQVEPDTTSVGHQIMSVFQVGRWDNGCSDNIGWAYSNNGGQDWQHGFMPGLTRNSKPAGPFVRASDPSIAYNAAFGVWIAASLDCNGTSPNPNAFVSSPSVSVNVSADGVHWSNAIIVDKIKKGQDFDKSWITCDNTVTSNFFGNCYVEWDVDNQGDLVQMSTSTDGGLHWSAAANTVDHLGATGGEPVVQPNGTVVVPILGFGPHGTVLIDFRSTNGGRTWSRETAVSGFFQHTFGGGLRGPFFPTVAEDGSGRIYISWPDCRFRPNCSANDMVLTTSADGVHWTPVTRIPIDPVSSNVDHLGGGLGVDASTSGAHARLALFYNFYPDAGCTVTTCRLFEGYVSSTDGGRHWSAPQVLAGPMRMSELASAFGFMVGDYEGTAILPGGNAFSAFAIGGIPAGQQFNEAMYDVTGGMPVTGGTHLATAAGVQHHLTPAPRPGVRRTR